MGKARQYLNGQRCFSMINKPPHGAKCNGCGLCCQMEKCPLGTAVFSGIPSNGNADVWAGPCPGLVPHADGSYGCGLVETPERFAPVRAAAFGKDKLRKAAMYLIGAGIGCDGQLDDEPYDEKFGWRMRMHRDDRKINRAFHLWGFALNQVRALLGEYNER
jgi:hypothetical protein